MARWPGAVAGGGDGPKGVGLACSSVEGGFERAAPTHASVRTISPHASRRSPNRRSTGFPLPQGGPPPSRQSPRVSRSPATRPTMLENMRAGKRRPTTSSAHSRGERMVISSTMSACRVVCKVSATLPETLPSHAAPALRRATLPVFSPATRVGRSEAWKQTT